MHEASKKNYGGLVKQNVFSLKRRKDGRNSQIFIIHIFLEKIMILPSTELPLRI